MTPQDAARILAPIRIGFLSARLRIKEQREAAENMTGSAAYRAVADLDAAEEYLIAREAQWDFAGMLSAVMAGHRACIWPNVMPDQETMAASLDAWTAGKPELKAKLDALMVPPGIAIVKRLTVARASGE